MRGNVRRLSSSANSNRRALDQSVPVPVSVTTSGAMVVPDEVHRMVRLPVLAPSAVGAKPTQMEHDAPAASVLGQLLDKRKSPA